MRLAASEATERLGRRPGEATDDSAVRRETCVVRTGGNRQGQQIRWGERMRGYDPGDLDGEERVRFLSADRKEVE